MDQDVVIAAKSFAVNQLSSNLHPKISFHDLQHTQTVVSVSTDLAKAEGVSENDISILQVAAWFHDLGYPIKVEGHEKIGAEMVREFLSGQNVNSEEIKKVEGLIESTEISKKPQNLLEKIIRDADMAHLGMSNAKERSLKLREEREAMLSLSYSDKEWLKINYDFYKDHRYNTRTAREKYGHKKDAYLEWMRKRLNPNQ